MQLTLPKNFCAPDVRAKQQNPCLSISNSDALKLFYFTQIQMKGQFNLPSLITCIKVEFCELFGKK